MILRMLDAVVSSYMDGGTVVTVSGATVIGEAITGWGVGAAGAAADEAVAVAVAVAAAGAAAAAGTGAESLAAHPSLPRKLIRVALPDGRLAASLTAVDSTMVLLLWAFGGDASVFGRQLGGREVVHERHDERGDGWRHFTP